MQPDYMALEHPHTPRCCLVSLQIFHVAESNKNIQVYLFISNLIISVAITFLVAGFVRPVVMRLADKRYGVNGVMNSVPVQGMFTHTACTPREVSRPTVSGLCRVFA